MQHAAPFEKAETKQTPPCAKPIMHAVYGWMSSTAAALWIETDEQSGKKKLKV